MISSMITLIGIRTFQELIVDHATQYWFEDLSVMRSVNFVIIPFLTHHVSYSQLRLSLYMLLLGIVLFSNSVRYKNIKLRVCLCETGPGHQNKKKKNFSILSLTVFEIYRKPLFDFNSLEMKLLFESVVEISAGNYDYYHLQFNYLNVIFL